MSFYKDHYQVVIVGGALAGMSACLQLQAWGIKDILILEKHNLPGGLATSFVRSGREIEATLHEMMSIGNEKDQLKVGAFFEEMGVDIKWLPVPECYRVVCPEDDLDMILHDGYETAAREIDKEVPGTYQQTLDFFKLMRRVYDSMNYLSVNEVPKAKMLLQHTDFVRTLGYSATEVMDALGIPDRVGRIRSTPCMYGGHPVGRSPFTSN